MREQDKALFLQLIKLHTTIKEIRSEMKFMEENCDSPFDSYDGATSYWCKLKINLRKLITLESLWLTFLDRRKVQFFKARIRVSANMIEMLQHSFSNFFCQCGFIFRFISKSLQKSI